MCRKSMDLCHKMQCMYLLKIFASNHWDNSLFSAFFLTKTFMSECWEIQQLLENILRYCLFRTFRNKLFQVQNYCVHQKCLGDSPLSFYYSVICSNCLGNVVMGMEKCGKMCKNVWKCGKMCWRPVFYILLILFISCIYKNNQRSVQNIISARIIHGIVTKKKNKRCGELF